MGQRVCEKDASLVPGADELLQPPGEPSSAQMQGPRMVVIIAIVAGF